MKIRVRGNPDFGEATCVLEPGEKMLCEGRSMSRMSAHMELKVRAKGGLLRSAVRAVAGGESFFLSEYSSDHGGFVTVVPGTPGPWSPAAAGRDARPHRRVVPRLEQKVDIKTKFGGVKSLFGGEGAFLLFAKGHGDLLFSAFEASSSETRRLPDGGQRTRVAWGPSLTYQIKAVGGLKQTVFSGEGLVMEFKGRGRIWLQTRTLKETAGWITPYLMF